MTEENNTEEKAGVQRGSIEKVLNFVNKEKNPITISKMVEELNLHPTTIKSCIEFLNNLGKVEIITNGRTTLVRKKDNQNAITN